MNAGEWIISILLFIISLSILIVIHELGHLSMAKLFDVYCQEFSIGFGPALLHKRKEGKETYFSIRAIPLGGYVSMYGEDVKLEDGLEIPPERSLEGIKKWKKAIIVSAGVILNAILALILFSISNLCFPVIKASTTVHVTENSIVYNLGLRDDDKIVFASAKDSDVINHSYQYEVDKLIYAGNFCIVDGNIHMNKFNYVLTYYPLGTKNETKFTEGIRLYPAIDRAAVEKDKDFQKTYEQWFIKNDDGSITWKENALNFYPNFKEKYYQPYDLTDNFDCVVNYMKLIEKENPKYEASSLKLHIETTKDDSDKYYWKDVGFAFKLDSIWLPFGDRVANVFVDFGESATAVFRGLGILFTGGIRNMSGIIGILQTSATIYGTYAFSYYLYFWGLISVNLAIMNLLPFPGLDGFTLLVTAIEGITRKKIPTKFKNIMSTIGLFILLALMLVIVVLDVLRWTGI